MNEDDFYRDFHAFLNNNVIEETRQESLAKIRDYVPEDLQEKARDYVNDYFYEQP